MPTMSDEATPPIPSTASAAATMPTPVAPCERVQRDGMEAWRVIEETATDCKALMECHNGTQSTCRALCERSSMACINGWHEGTNGTVAPARCLAAHASYSCRCGDGAFDAIEPRLDTCAR